MDSTELYRQLLSVTSPWTVERVEMSVHDVRVDVYLGHAAGSRFACQECGGEHGVYDQADERQWRHLDSCQFHTLLHARAPRVKCPEHQRWPRLFRQFPGFAKWNSAGVDVELGNEDVAGQAAFGNAGSDAK